MTFLVVISAFTLFFITMAVGVLMGRKPIAGSCGGLANVGLNGECKVCGRTPGSCDSEEPETSSTNKIKPSNIVPFAVDAMASSSRKATPLDPLDF